MKTGIIVYSQTGNTLKVCGDIKSGLEQAGHSVSIEQVEIEKTPGADKSNIKLKNLPDPLKYDALIFASPVQAFSLALPMQKYMETIQNLAGKKTALLTTKGLPFRWTGASRALSQLKELAGRAGAEVVGKGIVIWPGRNAEEDTEAAILQLKKLF